MWSLSRCVETPENCNRGHPMTRKNSNNSSRHRGRLEKSRFPCEIQRPPFSTPLALVQGAASRSPSPLRAVIGDDAELWGWRSGEEESTKDNGDATYVRCLVNRMCTGDSTKPPSCTRAKRAALHIRNQRPVGRNFFFTANLNEIVVWLNCMHAMLGPGKN